MPRWIKGQTAKVAATTEFWSKIHREDAATILKVALSTLYGKGRDGKSKSWI